MAVTEKDVRKALKAVKDPELGLDLVVLGLIYDIEIEDAEVKATISLTSPLCPVAGQIVDDVKTAIEGGRWRRRRGGGAHLRSPLDAGTDRAAHQGFTRSLK